MFAHIFGKSSNNTSVQHESLAIDSDRKIVNCRSSGTNELPYELRLLWTVSYLAVVETAERNAESAPTTDQTRAKGVPVAQRVGPSADPAIHEAEAVGPISAPASPVAPAAEAAPTAENTPSTESLSSELSLSLFRRQ